MNGLDAIPTQLPTLSAVSQLPETSFLSKKAVRHALLSLSFTEAMHYSFLSKAELDAFDPNVTNRLAIPNPVSADYGILRDSLLPQLMGSLGRNAARQLKHYEYVIAIVTHGGVSQAAESLGLAQPTLSKYLKKLESDLGIELFDRSTLPIRLTRAGEIYVETGRRMLDLDRQLCKQLEEIKENKNTVIRVGISPSRSPRWDNACPNARKAEMAKMTSTRAKPSEKTVMIARSPLFKRMTESIKRRAGSLISEIQNILSKPRRASSKCGKTAEAFLIALIRRRYPTKSGKISIKLSGGLKRKTRAKRSLPQKKHFCFIFFSPFLFF
jgi:DNA-binding MarR family transcriptional regulator